MSKGVILIFGIKPPPIGGISIHIQRFFDKISKDERFEVYIVDIKKLKIFSKEREYTILKLFNLMFKVDIVHIHIVNRVKLLIALFFKILRKKVIYTNHGSIVHSRFILNSLHRVCDSIILVNRDNMDLDRELKESSKIYSIPAFIEPTLSDIDLDRDILEKISKFQNIISTNCYRQEFTLLRGKDTYGFDIVVSAFEKLSKRVDNSLLILVDPTDSSREYVQSLIEDIEITGSNDILYIGRAIDFAKLIQSSNLIVRATRTDGDSLTIREALFFGVPIIASDCVDRPEGVTLFQSENIEDLELKMYQSLNQDSEIKSYQRSFYSDIVDIYLELLRQKSEL